jgi:hypothetical protein
VSVGGRLDKASVHSSARSRQITYERWEEWVTEEGVEAADSNDVDVVEQP